MTKKQLANLQEWAGDGKSLDKHFEQKKPGDWLDVIKIARKVYSAMFDTEVEDESPIDDLFGCIAYYSAMWACRKVAKISNQKLSGEAVFSVISELGKDPVHEEEFFAKCRREDSFDSL